MNYKLLFLKSNTPADDFIEEKFGINYTDINITDDHLIMNEYQAILFKLTFPDIELETV